jgi:phosphinothricin acetyltransferase
MIVRPAVLSDAPAVRAIYEHHVLSGAGTFEIDPPSLEEIEQRMALLFKRGHPWLVAEDGEDMLGYAYATFFRERAAYAKTFENSIYVAPNAQGRGVGGALLRALLAICQELGAREILAVIGDSDNRASIALHAAAGFRKVGVLNNVGEKFGKLIDVVLMQYSAPPPK